MKSTCQHGMSSISLNGFFFPFRIFSPTVGHNLRFFVWRNKLCFCFNPVFLLWWYSMYEYHHIYFIRLTWLYVHLDDSRPPVDFSGVQNDLITYVVVFEG